MVLQQHEGRQISPSDLKRFNVLLREWFITHEYINDYFSNLTDVTCWEYGERPFLSGFVTVTNWGNGTSVKIGFHCYPDNEIVLVSKERIEYE